MSTQQASEHTVEPGTVRTFGNVLLIVAFALSVFHYLDNWTRFDRYALSPDSPVTAPYQIPLAWILFTAVGVIGYVQFRRSRWWGAVAGLGFYSLSGLVGLAHYNDAPPADFDSAQNLLIVTDVAAGIAVLGFALWLMFRRALPGLHTSGHTSGHSSGRTTG